MRVRTYFSLLAKNRFRFHPLGIGQGLIIAFMSTVNSALYRLQNLTHGKRISKVELTAPPIFIVGHWRSGTTLMHELIVRDPQFGFPNTYQCFAPNHFLISEWLFSRLFAWLLPNKRPMDNMRTGFSRPQEDEFAICAMGAPSPYKRMAFPNHPAPDMEFFNFEGAADNDLLRFDQAIQDFFAAQTIKHQKQLVLKSPPHTGRIGRLANTFPQSCFVHLLRNPYEMFASTVKLWRSLDRHQGFQLPNYSDEELHEYVLTCFELMYEGFNRDLDRIDRENLIEIKYEDLVQSPLECVERIYSTFDIDQSQEARDALVSYVESLKDYQASTYVIDDSLRDRINQRWGWYFERYEYPMKRSASANQPVPVN